MIKNETKKANFNEEFKIDTSFETDADDKLLTKISRLTVVGSKAVGVIGNVNFDLSKFDVEEYSIQTLILEKSKFDGASITVGLKGVPKSTSTIDVSTEPERLSHRASIADVSGDLHLSTMSANDSIANEESDDDEKL